MKSEYINKLLKKYDGDFLEKELLKLFLREHGITQCKNKDINEILKGGEINADVLKFYQKENRLSLYQLVNAFELIIPSVDRKLNGAFFTPETITRFIVSEFDLKKTSKLLDPSCGCGAFLIESAIALNQKFGLSFASIFKNNVYGIDIAHYNIKRCKILLTLLALINKEDEEYFEFNLRNEDSLSGVVFFSNILDEGGFDFVMGNPPYVKFQDLDQSQRVSISSDWKTTSKGAFNLYFPFFEFGIACLKKTGTLGFITPNNYAVSMAGEPLRRFFHESKLIHKIINFGHLKIFDVQTYTAVTFLKKRTKDYFFYKNIDDRALLAKTDFDFSKIYYKDLDDKKWRLQEEQDQERIKIIETAGLSLGDLFNIKVGIATCKDSIYFVDEAIENQDFCIKFYNDKAYKIEKSVTKEVVKISEHKDEVSLANNKRRLIFPYHKVNGKSEILKESEFKKLYPECYQYLLARKSDLKNRNKGKIATGVWYAYARNQGLDFQGQKLLTPTFSKEPRFLLETNLEALFCNGYGIFEKQTPSLLNVDIGLSVLQKILNSKIMDFYIRKTSVSIQGGYPCYQKNFIERFTFPIFRNEDIDYLKKEVSRAKIDRFLEEKYGIDLSD